MTVRVGPISFSTSFKRSLIAVKSSVSPAKSPVIPVKSPVMFVISAVIPAKSAAVAVAKSATLVAKPATLVATSPKPAVTSAISVVKSPIGSTRSATLSVNVLTSLATVRPYHKLPAEVMIAISNRTVIMFSIVVIFITHLIIYANLDYLYFFVMIHPTTKNSN